MICGSVTGEVLPPYVVYKSSQLWTTWTEGSPKGCHYHYTKSRWFDTVTYNGWFETIWLPRLKKCAGKRVVIAGNLSTHLNVQVFQKCHEENIHFICSSNPTIKCGILPSHKSSLVEGTNAMEKHT